MSNTAYDILLLSYGEISVKGRNRQKFQQQIEMVVRHALSRCGRPWTLESRHKRLQILIPPEAGETELGEVTDMLRRVPGLVHIYPAIRIARGDRRSGSSSGSGSVSGSGSGSAEERTLSVIQDTLLPLASRTYRDGARFAVRAKRADPRFGVSSEEMERLLGRALIEHTSWETVSLEYPDVTYRVEVYLDVVYVSRELSHEDNRGVGGLPVGSSGPVVSLLSGGIDSPVAAYLMAKRGCTVDMLHMTSSDPRNHDDPQIQKMLRIAEQVSRYTISSKLFIVPYAPFDMELLHAPNSYHVVLFRRFLLRLASYLARARGADALCAGESLGQVASQTYSNLVAISHAVDDTIFRPLITYDKPEIVDLARRIGTFEISTIPDKDCCALIQSNARTETRIPTVGRLEERAFGDMQGLIERTLAEGAVVSLDTGEIVDVTDDVSRELESPHAWSIPTFRSHQTRSPTS